MSIYTRTAKVFFIFPAGHSPVGLDIETEFLYYVFLHGCQKLEIGNFVSISSSTNKCAAQKLKKNAVLVYGRVYIIWSY